MPLVFDSTKADGQFRKTVSTVDVVSLAAERTAPLHCSKYLYQFSVIRHFHPLLVLVVAVAVITHLQFNCQMRYRIQCPTKQPCGPDRKCGLLPGFVDQHVLSRVAFVLQLQRLEDKPSIYTK